MAPLLRVKVEYVGKFKDITKKREEVIEFNGRTLLDLLHYLVRKYGERLKNAVLDGNSLREDVIILKNGRSVGENLNVELNSNDCVCFLPFVSGG